MVKAQCLWDVAIKMNSSIDSTDVLNVLVANFKPLLYVMLHFVATLAVSTFVLSILSS